MEFRISREDTTQSFEVTLIDSLRVDGSKIGDGLPIGRVQGVVHADMLPRGLRGDRTGKPERPGTVVVPGLSLGGGGRI